MKTIKLRNIILSINDINEICKVTHILKVYDDIKKNGFKYPIVLKKDKVLRRGTLRYSIAKHLGLKELKAVIEKKDSRHQVLKYTKLATHAFGGYGNE